MKTIKLMFVKIEANS